MKVIRCGGNDDGVTLRCQENSDTLGIVIENAGVCVCARAHLHVNVKLALYFTIDQDKVASFELKLMDIDAENLALPVSFVFC